MTTNHIKNDRKSPRARWFYYNSGLYFVTVCTRNRDHFFGDVIDGEMQLNEIGRYANLQFQNVMTHYPYAEIPVWIVMPNHIHAIVAIQRRRWDGCRDVCRSGCRDDVHIVPTAKTIVHTSNGNYRSYVRDNDHGNILELLYTTKIFI